MGAIFTPHAGQIVLAWMPESEQVCAPGPKFRPVLILECAIGNHEQHEALVSYGTSQQTGICRLGEFTIHPGPETLLKKPTKFSLLKRMWLPLSVEFFGGQADRPA